MQTTHPYGVRFGELVKTGVVAALIVMAGSSARAGIAYGTINNFDTVNDIQRQVVDARDWLGFHFRNSVEQGENVGNDVADWELGQFFQPN